MAVRKELIEELLANRNPGGAKWALPVHRRVLQLPPLALGNRLHDANAKGTTRSGRVGRNLCPPKRGRVALLFSFGLFIRPRCSEQYAGFGHRPSP
jgi:hypothetical protein